MKGYALNQRMDRLENNYDHLSKEVKQISLQLKTQELPNQGIFFEGQIFDAYVFEMNITQKAKINGISGYKTKGDKKITDNKIKLCQKK